MLGGKVDVQAWKEWGTLGKLVGWAAESRFYYIISCQSLELSVRVWRELRHFKGLGDIE